MIKEWGAKVYAYWSYIKNKKWINNPIATQQKLLKKIISQAKKRVLLRITILKNNRPKIISIVPIRDYEA